MQALLAFASIQEQASHLPTQDSARSEQDNLALDEVLGLVAARAISITGADGVAIALADQTAIVCRASAGRIAPNRGARIDPGSGFSGACLSSGQSIKCDDSETDPRVNAEACRALGTRSMVAVPLCAKSRVIGLIEVFSSEAYGFNDSDVNSLNLLGELILAAIRPEEENRMAELASRIVPAPRSDSSSPQAGSSGQAQSSPRAPQILVDESSAPLRQPMPSPLPQSRDAEIPAAEVLVVAESSESAEPQAPALNLELPTAGSNRSVVGIAVVVGLAILAAALGWLLIGKIRHTEQSISASTHNAPDANAAAQMTQAPAASAAPLSPGAIPQVTALHHWSSSESSTVVLDLEDQVQYESHSLEDPPRIYFDLHDTKLAASLVNSSTSIDDNFLKRVRIAQPSTGITRVVLETKGDLEFSVQLDPNPYRLIIEVHRPGSAPAATSPAPSNKPSPAIEPAKKSRASLDTADFKIVLDAGHGGWDLGTVGRKGLLEKDLVLDVVARLGKLIEDKLGSQVIYTRDDDTYIPLEKRAEIANLARADMFLSVHANYSDLATARGVETYYTGTYSSVKARTDDNSPSLTQVNWTGVDIRAKVMDSRRLATDIQQALFGGLAARNPELRNRGVKKAEYVVLTGTQMPAVLAEVSFVSSPADEDKLQNSEYRQRIAEALYRGVARYYREITKTKIAKAAN